MIARRRLGKVQGVSAVIFMVLISLTLALVLRLCAESFSMPMKDNEKQDFC